MRWRVASGVVVGFQVLLVLNAPSVEGLPAVSLEYDLEPDSYENAVLVATPSTFIYPRLAVDRDPASAAYGSLYVVGFGYEFPDWTFRVIHSRDGGRTFEPPVTTNLNLYGPMDVVVRGGALYIGTFGPKLFRSPDGGSTWENLTVLDATDALPSLAVDRGAGRLHVAWATTSDPWSAGPPGRIRVASSPDGGNWSGANDIPSADAMGYAPQVAAFEDAVVVAFLAAGAGDPYVAFVTSANGGATWGNVTPLSTPAPCMRWSAPSIAVSPNGTFAVSWYEDPGRPSGCWDAWGNTTRTFVAFSTDRGRSFSPPVAAGGPPGWPTVTFGDALAFDERSRVYVTWHSIAPNWTSASVSVAVSSSIDGTFEEASFQTRFQITGAGNSTQQENLAVGVDGAIHLLWVGYGVESGVYVRTVTGEATGTLADPGGALAASEAHIAVRDALGGLVARALWTGAPASLRELAPGAYDVWVEVGPDASRAGAIPVKAWGRTSFTIQVGGEAVGSLPPPVLGLLTASIAGLTVAGTIVLAIRVLRRRRRTT